MPGQPTAPIHVAYNPYFPKEADIKREKKRIAQKLRTGAAPQLWEAVS